ALDDGGGARLPLLADRAVELAAERLRIRRRHERQVVGRRLRLPVEEVAAAGDAVEGDLVRAEDQAGEPVPRGADAAHAAPRARGIARVDADRVAVDAADRLARPLVAGRPPLVAQEQLVG